MLVSHSQAIVLGRAERPCSARPECDTPGENTLRLREDNHSPGPPAHEAVWAEIRAM
jgi:hypothetical protein